MCDRGAGSVIPRMGASRRGRYGVIAPRYPLRYMPVAHNVRSYRKAERPCLTY
ncbi:hypothetical protein DyAD56_12930 [Dyella sp. AD56]|nr:hypothetical protein DyAD56_12930 [Dyella sp. AD56]